MFRFLKNSSEKMQTKKNSALIPGAVRRHMVFEGRVQGVGFRYQASTYARQLGLTGWVRNEYNGTVVMEVQGEEAQIHELVTTLAKTAYIHVEYVRSEPMPLQEEYTFRVTY